MPYVGDNLPHSGANGIRFNHETGFHGVVKIGKTAFKNAEEAKNTNSYNDLVTILATSGSCAIAHDPIISQGIWGAGWYNAAEQVAYSNNVLKMTGSVGYELIVGNVFDALLSFGFENRAADFGHGVVILPDGEHGFMGPGWCSQVDMSASTDSNVTGNMSYSSAILSRVSNEIGKNFITSDDVMDENKAKYGVGFHPGLTTPGIPPYDDVNKPVAATGNEFLGMFPFWATGVYGKSDGTTSGSKTITVSKNLYNIIDNVQDWSAQYSSSVEFMTLCSGYTPSSDPDSDPVNGPITPDYIMIGSMQGSGSFTFVGLSSQISPDSIYNQKSYAIVVRPNSHLGVEDKWGLIELPSVIYNNVNIQTTTGSQLVTASVDVTALGDGSRPPMSFSKFSTTASSGSGTGE